MLCYVLRIFNYSEAFCKILSLLGIVIKSYRMFTAIVFYIEISSVFIIMYHDIGNLKRDKYNFYIDCFLLYSE